MGGVKAVVELHVSSRSCFLSQLCRINNRACLSVFIVYYDLYRQCVVYIGLYRIAILRVRCVYRCLCLVVGNKNGVCLLQSVLGGKTMLAEPQACHSITTASAMGK